MIRIIARLGIVGAFAIGAVYCARANAAAPYPPVGIWQTEDGRARVRTEPCGPGGTNLCGYVVWLKKPNDENGRALTDKLNSDPSKQGRAILGHQVLLDLAPNTSGEYEGKIYNSEDGKTYDATVQKVDSAKLVVKGCLLVFCGEQIWKRTADVLPGQIK